MTTSQQSTLIYSIAGLILAIPFIAMQFSEEVNWTLFDFLIGGILLFSTAFAIDLTLRKVKKTKDRILIALMIFVTFILIWIEIAVGVFGIPIAGS